MIAPAVPRAGPEGARGRLQPAAEAGDEQRRDRAAGGRGERRGRRLLCSRASVASGGGGVERVK